MTAIDARIEVPAFGEQPSSYKEIVPEGYTPKYGKFYDELGYMRKLEGMAFSLLAQGRITEDDADKSIAFAENAHAEFSGIIKPDSETSFVFAVPTRVTHKEGHLYPSEIAPFLPMANAGLSGTELLYMLDGMPPCVIESYTPDENGRQGKVLFVPLFGDILQDMSRTPTNYLGNKLGSKIGGLRARSIARNIINVAAGFANEKLGADVMGLGAVLPALTDFGRTINVPGLTTTTGHGGTVALIGKEVGQVVDTIGMPNNTIGIVGAAGSIGRSSLALLLEQYPNANFTVQDIRSMDRVMDSLSDTDRDRIRVVGDLPDVFSDASVVVSAITSTIRLAEKYPELDLTGKVIVDDSQPGAFRREEVENSGGNIVWVVGADKTPNNAVTRMGGYRFGDKAGLMRSSDVWGCEAEASTITRTGERGAAIRSAVTPDMARRIGDLFEEAGIGVAPFQAFGKPVDLSKAAQLNGKVA